MGYSTIVKFNLLSHLSKLVRLHESEETKEESGEEEIVEEPCVIAVKDDVKEQRANEAQRTPSEPRVIAAMHKAR